MGEGWPVKVEWGREGANIKESSLKPLIKVEGVLRPP